MEQIKSLTGLRFVAALMVFVHHIQGQFQIARFELPLANNAVSFFFVLSGFILTLVYRDRLHDRAAILDFLKRRVARLWPLHFACMLLCMLLVSHTGYTPGAVASHLLLIQSWIPDPRYAFALNQVSWSISTEFWFYMAFPGLLIGRRFGLKFLGVLMLGVLILASCQSGVQREWFSLETSRMIIHLNPLVRLAEFAAGMLTGFLALQWSRKRPKASGLTGQALTDTLLEVSSVGLLVGYWAWLDAYQILTVVHGWPWIGQSLSTWLWFGSSFPWFMIIVFVFSRSQGWLAHWMGSTSMVHLGDISFAFYMIHMIVIRILRQQFAPDLFQGSLAFVTCLVVSLAASQILYSLVELPGKQLMLKLLNLAPREAMHQGLGLVRQHLLRPSTVVAILVLLITVGWARWWNFDSYLDRQITRVMQATPERLKNLQFEEVAQLEACLVRDDQNALLIDMVWSKLEPGKRRNRTIEIRDEAGSVLRQLTLPRYKTESQKYLGYVFDDVRIDREQPGLEKLASIHLRYTSPQGPAAEVSKAGSKSGLSSVRLFPVPSDQELDFFSIEDPSLRTLVSQTPESERNALFGHSDTLYGFSAKSTNEGALLELAWSPSNSSDQALRVIHLVNEQDEIVDTLMASSETIDSTHPLSWDRQQFEITADQLRNCRFVTLGLWIRGQGMLKIDRGRRIHANQRLVLYSKEADGFQDSNDPG